MRIIKSRKYNSKLGLNIVMMFFMLLYLLPLYYILINAFKERADISKSPFLLTPEMFTMDSVIETFIRMDYTRTLYNSVLTLVMMCIMLIILGSLAGFGITYARNKPLNLTYLIYIALISMPLQIAMVPLMIILRDLGLTDTHLGMALVFNAIYLPFVVFLYTGFMRTIPRDLIDAAKIDGCHAFGIYLKIFMPLLTTITGVVVILRGVSAWNDLFVPIIVVNKGNMYTLPMMLYFFASSREGVSQLIFGATFLCILPIIILFLAMQKTFIKGIMAGSIKG